jgi:FtsP/CotA-like multicopper oxidase with cupredoxin domain
MPERSGPPKKQRFDDLLQAKVTAQRTLYFLEIPRKERSGPPPEGVNFYIVVDGQTPKLYDPNDPPAITTTRGAVEDWIIENRTFEVHEFHMHQIHFLLLERNGKPVPPDERQFLDTVQVGYWDGIHKYPNVKVRMDFRGAVVGDFVYHCHILDHEDGGMMAIIRVTPPKPKEKAA